MVSAGQTQDVAASGGRAACSVCRVLYRGSFERCPRDGGLIVPFAEDDDPLLGSTLGGRYVIEALLGEGAMGRVYRACHVELPRRFALKIPFGEVAAVSELRARFRLEAEAASRLDHANVVSVLDVGETDEGLLYLAMELVEGRELRSIVALEAPLEASRVAALARRLCRGLQHAHDAGMVHRDFKPENVIVVDEMGVEVPRITDFGLAIPIAEPGRRLTGDGAAIAGTPPYMSPEQLAGEPLDARSDLYALGVVLYEMLAGVPPHDGTPREIARKVMSERPPPLRGRTPGVEVPAPLERIVLRLLERRPADRYATATEVLAALDEAPAPPTRTRTRPTSAAPPALPAPRKLDATDELLALVKARRRPPRAVLLAGGAMLLVGAAAVTATSRRPPRSRPSRSPRARRRPPRLRRPRRGPSRRPRPRPRPRRRPRPSRRPPPSPRRPRAGPPRRRHRRHPGRPHRRQRLAPSRRAAPTRAPTISTTRAPGSTWPGGSPTPRRSTRPRCPPTLATPRRIAASGSSTRRRAIDRARSITCAGISTWRRARRTPRPCVRASTR